MDSKPKLDHLRNIIVLLIVVLSIGACGRKYPTDSRREDWRKKSSCEIEHSYQPMVNANNTKFPNEPENHVFTSANPDIVQLAPEIKIDPRTETSINSQMTEIPSGGKLQSKTPVKNIAKVKIVEKIKARISKNIKVGLILLLVGVVLTTIGIWEIGSIVVVVGVVFLVLGLIEMM